MAETILIDQIFEKWELGADLKIDEHKQEVKIREK
jgi:hypothetical protein